MIDLEELLARAQAAMDAGNPLVARGYWRRASRIAPDRLDVWVALCKVTELPAERKRCLEHIVELDPGNARARAELADLQEQETETESEVSEEAPDVLDAETEDVPQPVEEILASVHPEVTAEMVRQWDEAIVAGKPLVCIDHPTRETSLRCNRCGVPICTKCAVRTPVGFRCKECVKAQQSVFFTARWVDYPVAALIALVLSVPAAVLAGMVGWWFALIISPLAGGLIGGIVHRAIGRRRGQWIWLMVGACVALGALVALVVNPPSFIAAGVYAVTATGAAIGVLRWGRTR
jgi:hypothetical protein